MSEFYVFWRAQLKAGRAPESAGHFLRAVDELAAHAHVVAPVYDCGGDPRTVDSQPSGQVGFGFAVEGFDSPFEARDWAEVVLRRSLHSAEIGTPDIPAGDTPDVRLLLDDNPTIRLMAADSWLTHLAPLVL